MQRLYLFSSFFMIFLVSTQSLEIHASVSAEEKGKFLGGMVTEYPSWFKDSFLDIQDDIAEAAAENKRLVIFFSQDGCPYCNAMVERNFSQQDIVEKAKKHFDFITINMWGDRPVVDVDGNEYTEKTFAENMKVQFTPTIVFYNEQGKIVLRINGYHSPQRFSLELDYVASHSETKGSYWDFMKANRPSIRTSKTLNNQMFFNHSEFDYSKKINKDARPFAVFFEQKDCPACDLLHTKVLPDEELQSVIKQFDTTQLDIWSQKVITTPGGEKLTARDWAAKLEIKFAPTIVIFNHKGEEIIRTEAFFKVFHTQGVFHYVLSEGYKKQPSFQRFLTDYADHFREQGRDVDIWRFADEKSGINKD